MNVRPPIANRKDNYPSSIHEYHTLQIPFVDKHNLWENAYAAPPWEHNTCNWFVIRNTMVSITRLTRTTMWWQLHEPNSQCRISWIEFMAFSMVIMRTRLLETSLWRDISAKRHLLTGTSEQRHIENHTNYFQCVKTMLRKNSILNSLSYFPLFILPLVPFLSLFSLFILSKVSRPWTSKTA